jgi:hypothetical protein
VGWEGKGKGGTTFLQRPVTPPGWLLFGNMKHTGQKVENGASRP